MTQPSGSSVAVGCVLSVGTIGLLNYLQSALKPWCDDCGQPSGIPFTYHLDSGWGNDGFVWPGVLGNLAVIFACAFAFAWLFERIKNSRRA